MEFNSIIIDVVLDATIMKRKKLNLFIILMLDTGL
jgi:hypothetical protein